MFESWTVKQTMTNLGGLLLVVAIIQIFLFLTSQSMYVHFGLSFVALFIALLLFHTLNLKMKKKKK